MTSRPEAPPKRWGIRRLAVLAFLGAATAFVVIDFIMVGGSPRAFVPESATYVFADEDFPETWREWNVSELRAAVLSESGDATAAFFLDARKRTGIRWTPLRFRTWLGRSLVIAGNGERWAVMVRPGVLYRIVRAIPGFDMRLIPLIQDEGSDYYTAYGDGVHFVANDAAWLSECLAAKSRRLAFLPWPVLSVRGENAAAVNLLDYDTPLVTGQVEDRAVESGAAQRLAPVAGIDAPLVISGHNWRLWMERFREWRPESPVLAEWFAVLRELDAALPAGWADAPAPFALVLREVDVNGVRPLPEVGVVFASDQPPQDQPLDGYPYVWGNARGWVRPLESNRLVAAYGEAPGRRYYASAEHVIRELTTMDVATVQTENPELRIEVQGTEMGFRLQRLMAQAADNELLEQRNGDDVEDEWKLFFDIATALDRITLEARHDGGYWKLKAWSTLRDVE